MKGRPRKFLEDVSEEGIVPPGIVSSLLDTVDGPETRRNYWSLETVGYTDSLYFLFLQKQQNLVTLNVHKQWSRTGTDGTDYVNDISDLH